MDMQDWGDLQDQSDWDILVAPALREGRQVVIGLASRLVAVAQEGDSVQYYLTADTVAAIQHQMTTVQSILESPAGPAGKFLFIQCQG